ncbi:MAG: alpha/beta hydrolase, partial [Actinomycetota bacterium]
VMRASSPAATTRVGAAGEDALITEPYIDAWTGHIGHAEATTVAGAGHLVNLERPKELAAALAAFLAA